MEFEFNDNPLDSLDPVPDDFRGLYVKDAATNKFKLDTTHAGVKSSVAAIARMQAALKKERMESKAKDGKIVDLSPLAPYGATIPDIITGIEAKIKEARGSASETLEKQVAKIKEDLAKGHAKEIEGHTTRNKTLTGQLFALLGTGVAKAELIAADVVDVDLAMPFVLEFLKPEEKDGKFGVVVVDSAGDPRYSGTGGPMTVKELILEMKGKPKFGPLFKSPTKAGGGARPGSTNRPAGAKGDETPAPSATEKIARGLEARYGRRG